MKIAKGCVSIISFHCLGICLTASASINNDSNTVTISAFSNTTKPMVYIYGYSYASDNIGGKEFKMTLSYAEMLQLNTFKKQSEYSPSNNLYLLPVAKFQYCVHAVDLNDGVNIKVNNARFRDTNNNTIHAYVHIHGNGLASAGQKDLLFGYDDGHDIATIRRLIPVNNQMPSSALSHDNNFSTTSEFDATSLAAITKVENNDSNYVQLDHYFLGADSYSLTSTTATTRSDANYVYDSTSFDDSTCGTNNAGAVDVIIYTNIADILQVPAGSYDATISFSFEADGG